MVEIENKLNRIKKMLNSLVGDYNIRIDISYKYYNLELEYTNINDDEEYIKSFLNYKSLNNLLDDVSKFIDDEV